MAAKARVQSNKIKHHYSVGFYIWTVVKIFFACFLLLQCGSARFVSRVITAFKTDAEYKSTNVMTPPVSWFNFSNFAKAFTTANMGMHLRIPLSS